ncbi:hypothetical protein JG688_00015346 [Phytophthora aleatoria]|uniref:Uncharacterized protein n=1 Tax=Phytophthora aleatoria TaxID=2496075 RepID=A0A8J5MDG5_9STRA|nr:hypothetical protein JG688_00015346 [Phytophthora aleatoria]
MSITSSKQSSRLLFVSQHWRCFTGSSKETMIFFPTQLDVLGNPFFWSELKRAESVISPLSYASYRLQRDENTVGIDQDILRRDELVSCVEYRWLQCEQPLFMLGYALHPVYAEDARTLPSTAISGVGSLPKLAVYYFRRLFDTEKVGTIRRNMFHWMENRFTRTRPSEFDGSLGIRR